MEGHQHPRGRWSWRCELVAWGRTKSIDRSVQVSVKGVRLGLLRHCCVDARCVAEPAMWGTRARSRNVDTDRSTPGMITRMNEGDNPDVGRAPICPFCGVTALPADASNVIDSGFVCENPDCDAFGDAVES